MQDPAQQMMQQTLLSQLRDVQLPDAVSWWPPALGWWVMLVLLGVAMVAIVRSLLKQRRANAYRRLALTELQNHFQQWQIDEQPTHYLQQANAVLKRCLLSMEIRTDSLVSQSGPRWISALQRLASKPLSEETSLAVSKRCYEAKPEVDIPQIHSELERWIRTHQRPKTNSKLPADVTGADYA